MKQIIKQMLIIICEKKVISSNATYQYSGLKFLNTYGLVQYYSNSSALAVEL